MKPTKKEIACGLNADHWWYRWAWAKRMDYTPTPAQVDRGLKDDVLRVRRVWAKRLDFTPTADQVACGLNDEDRDVRYAWEVRIPEAKQKPVRCRSEKGHLFWYVNPFGFAMDTKEDWATSCDELYRVGNYFETQDDAKASPIYKAFPGNKT